MQTFLLVLAFLASDGAYKAEVMDHGLTYEDCLAAAAKQAPHLKPGQALSCEEE
jgi:hypothetical protein